jgi:hypothetical protein
VRKARSFKTVAVGGVALAAVVLSVMYALYLRYVRYDRVAAWHLPSAPVLAVRVDVEQAIFYEPIRRHLLPLFGGPGDSPTEADARLARIEVRSRLKRGDLREIVVARGKAPGDWVVVLGGIFPKSDLLVTALSDEHAWAPSANGHRAVHRGTGVAVARADDGAVVIASSSELLASALPSSDAFERLGLVATGVGGFALSREALVELARWPQILAAGELPAHLGQIDSVTGQFTPGDRIRVVVRFQGGPEGEAERAADGALELMKAMSQMCNDRGNQLLRGAVDRAVIRKGTSGVELALEWERSEVDYALSALAEAIRSRW